MSLPSGSGYYFLIENFASPNSTNLYKRKKEKENEQLYFINKQGILKNQANTSTFELVMYIIDNSEKTDK